MKVPAFGAPKSNVFDGVRTVVVQADERRRLFQALGWWCISCGTRRGLPAYDGVTLDHVRIIEHIFDD